MSTGSGRGPASSAGRNLPSFRAVQLDFAAHIRNPAVHPIPEGIEPRRMQIYLDLFYNNIEGFLAGTFPVAKRLLGDERWHGLARRFVHEHPSESPYFLDICQEFLVFLEERKPEAAPDYLLELCHYEWVELSLRVDERELPEQGFAADGDLLLGQPLLNPLLWLLTYRYPVHQLRPGQIPEQAPAVPTRLVVYRDNEDQVRFRTLTSAAYLVLDALRAVSEEGAAATSGRDLLERLGEQIADAKARTAFVQAGGSLLTRFRQAGVILGTAEPEVAP